jgi:hypothetical protein
MSFLRREAPDGHDVRGGETRDDFLMREKGRDGHGLFALDNPSHGQQNLVSGRRDSSAAAGRSGTKFAPDGGLGMTA